MVIFYEMCYIVISVVLTQICINACGSCQILLSSCSRNNIFLTKKKKFQVLPGLAPAAPCAYLPHLGTRGRLRQEGRSPVGVRIRSDQTNSLFFFQKFIYLERINDWFLENVKAERFRVS